MRWGLFGSLLVVALEFRKFKSILFILVLRCLLELSTVGSCRIIMTSASSNRWSSHILNCDLKKKPLRLTQYLTTVEFIITESFIHWIRTHYDYKTNQLLWLFTKFDDLNRPISESLKFCTEPKYLTDTVVLLKMYIVGTNLRMPAALFVSYLP